MNEIDDQFAIAYALGSPTLEVMAIISSHNTLVHGHDSVNIYQQEAQRVIDLCGRSDVPCLKGAQRPMESINEYLPSEGLEFIVNLARQGVEFSILGTGPATDLAAFKLGYPDLAKKVPIIWAGSFPDEKTWKKYKYGELNARADIAAWRVLYENHENLVVLPGWPGVVKVAVENSSFIPKLREKNKPILNFLAEILENWGHGRITLDMDSKRPSKVLWDIVNIAYFTVPDAVSTREMPIPQIDSAGSMYWDRPIARIPICMDVDEVAIMKDFWEAMQRLPD
jgi:inosine-uridine nucleoside N-ribohydrolase